MTVQTTTDTTSATTWMCLLFTWNWVALSKTNSHCRNVNYGNFWSHGIKIFSVTVEPFWLESLKNAWFFPFLYCQLTDVWKQHFVTLSWFESMIETNYRTSYNRDNYRDNDCSNYNRDYFSYHLNVFSLDIKLVGFIKSKFTLFYAEI